MKGNNSNGSRILLVEDEQTLAIGLEYNLSEEGYVVVRAEDGRQALNYFESQEFDLIILDIMLPYYNGFDVAKKIREKSPQIPILILTARTTALDRVHGLEIGADDYLTKPFHLAEQYFIENKGKIVSRKELLENVWDINSEIETRTVDNFIVRLRKYFEPNPAKPIYFKSVRSAGYMFSEETT